MLNALFFQATQALPVFRSREILVERQIQICVVIGWRLADAEELRMQNVCSAAGLPEADTLLTAILSSLKWQRLPLM